MRIPIGSDPPDTVPTVDAAAARRAIRLAALATLAIVVAGLAGIPRAGTTSFVNYSLFFEQFAKIEAMPLALVALFVGGILFALRRAPGVDQDPMPQARYRRWVILLIALAVVIVALAGVELVFQRFILSDDEFAAWFQAIIFAHGKASATVGADWCSYMPALTPTSVVAKADCTWRLAYLPLHSLLQAPFIAMGIGRLAVPLTAGVCVWLTAEIARKVWPSRPARAYLAAIFMATSTQVLFTSMTLFSMSTHLLLSLIFLWCYADDRPWSNFALPWVGVLALGVHSPLPHLFFVPPFLLRYVWQRRWMMLVYISGVYAAGLVYWIAYLKALSAPVPGNAPWAHAAPAAAAPTAIASAAQAAAGFHSLFRIPDAVLRFTATLHIALIPSWNAPILLVLAIAAMLVWRRLDGFTRAAALSLVLSIVVRVFVPSPQGEGWGYRFIYPGLGCLVLLAAVGADVLWHAVGARRARTLLVVSTVLALVVQFPMRVWGVNQIVGPYRDGYAWMTSLPYDVVVYPSGAVSWGRQLIRNDPFLATTPTIVSQPNLSQSEFDHITKALPIRVKVIMPAELRAHGLPMRSFFVGGILINP